MPRINRKKFVAKAKAGGVKGKAMRKSFRAETKVLNGGKSRLARLGKGALKIGLSAIPGVGGGLSDALAGGDNAIDPATLPIFGGGSSDTSMAGESNKQGARVVDMPSLATSPFIPSQEVNRNTLPPVFGGGGEGRSMSEETGGSGGSKRSIADDLEQQDYADKRETANKEKGTAAPTPEPPKDNNKKWLIALAVVAGIVTIVFIIKAFKK